MSAPTTENEQRALLELMVLIERDAEVDDRDIARMASKHGLDPGRLAGLVAGYRDLLGRLGRRADLPQLRPGEVVDDFVVEGFVASGGSGSVYRARQLSLGGREVALKVVSSAGLDAEQRLRLERGTRLASTVTHPALVGVHACGWDEKRRLLWCAMRLVEGRSLANVLEDFRRAGRRPDAEECELLVRRVVEVARALGALHGRGLAHRDVKPANIVLDGPWHSCGLEAPAVVVDLGLVRPLADSATTMPVVTLGYAAPERLRGAPGNARSDVYGLGLTLYDLLLGCGPDERPRAANAETVPLVEARPELAPRISTLVRRSLNDDPGRRPPDGRTLARVLEASLGGGPVLGTIRPRPHRRALLVGGVAALGAGACWLWTRAPAPHPRIRIEELSGRGPRFKIYGAGPGEDFGNALSLSGGRLAVGAQYRAGSGSRRAFTKAGAVELFRLEGRTWVHEQTLEPPNLQSEARFGSQVKLWGDRLLVGAWGLDSTVRNSGSVYLYGHVEGRWIQLAPVHAGNVESERRFGSNLAANGTWIAVSALLATVNEPGGEGLERAGAVILCEHFDEGVLSPGLRLEAREPMAGAQFGAGLAMEGDTLLVGENRRELDGLKDAGEVYVFRLNQGEWERGKPLTETMSQRPGKGSEFGCAIAVESGRAVVGAEGVDAAYFFEQGEPEGWKEQERLPAPVGNDGSHFGCSLAMEGDRLVIGAELANRPGVDDCASGGAFLYERGTDEWKDPRPLWAHDAGSGDAAASANSLDLSGDWVAMGARQADANGKGSGAVYLFDMGG